jgi:hypothetical protein
VSKEKIKKERKKERKRMETKLKKQVEKVNAIKKDNKKLKTQTEGKADRRIARSRFKFTSLHEEQFLLLALDAVSCSETCHSCRRHTAHPSSNYGRFGKTRFPYLQF